MKKTLNIIFTIDQAYIQHFTVALISVCENNPDLNLNIFVIHDLEDLTLINEIQAFFKAKYNLLISLLSLESSSFNNYTLTHHVSKATYFRLMIAEIMPKNIKTALFLDSDLLVLGSLRALVEFDLEGNYLSAVEDLVDIESLHRMNRLGIPAKRYFNAGVMYINLEKWQSDKVSVGLIATAKEYMERLLWWDQDVLNIFFYNKWKPLSPTFNEKHLTKRLKDKPVVVHFAGTSKPWLYLNNHPYKKEYWHYLRLSPFKDYRYKDFSLKNLIKRIVFFYKPQ
ncbi:glycosyltransferase family 8 protein [Mucilaginibacter endophyticus]|uniref:glycosyltransferase family 8 protein n=1 Tax=Mucilaginibacter endophyticus TaxID=2675003 RepID=UPI00137A8020|nr:glycosyltransferase family 8 protein [Mucilaginibacter endophyticus]